MEQRGINKKSRRLDVRSRKRPDRRFGLPFARETQLTEQEVSRMSVQTETQPQTSAAELDAMCMNTIRFLSVDAVQAANSGHPGLPLDAAPMAYVLWSAIFETRSGRSRLVRSRPFRAFGRTRLDAAL